MDEKNVDEKKLEGVTGGRDSVVEFHEKFKTKNCILCAKWGNGTCPYEGNAWKKFYAFSGESNAVCPDRESKGSARELKC